MRIKRSYIAAVTIALIIGAWFVSGQLSGMPPGAGQNIPAEPAATAASTQDLVLTHVRARVVKAEPRQTDLVVRGRTEANRRVQVRAETSGVVVALPVDKGSFVSQGDLLCELSLDAREARMKEAKALMRQRYLEYQASVKLAKKGHRSETQAAGSQAAYEAAQALVKAMEVEIQQTRILAPFDGVLEERPVEIGDYMQVSAPCATVFDMDPFLVVGQVSERDIGKIRLGGDGRATLVSGQEVEGIISFIGQTADPNTRTFRVELGVPNPDYLLRDGVTAEIRIPVQEVTAHRISPAVLSLNDEGVIGVRTVDEAGIVAFRPVEIVADGPDGVWVSGLEETVTLITVGQEFVTEGQRVEVSLDDPEVSS